MIYESVLTSLAELENEKPDMMTKLVAMSSDGAPVMLGHKGGFLALLKKDQPQVVGIHCMAHRLELAFKNSIKEIPMWNKLDSLLLSIYLYYHKSAANRAMLKRSFDARGEVHLMPTRVGGTRWVSHITLALDHLRRSYGALVTHLTQVLQFNIT